MLWLRRLLWLALLTALVLAEVGCATRSIPPTGTSEEVRARLGRVGVVTAGFAPEVDLSRPAPGGLAAAAAGAGANFGVGLLAATGCFLTGGHIAELCLIGLWTPAMTVNGAVEGAVKGVPARAVKTGKAALGEVAREGDLQQALREHFLEGLDRRGPARAVVVLTAPAPAGPDHLPSYRHLATQGLDSVVEVAALRLGLERGNGFDTRKTWGVSFSVQPMIDPTLDLILEARVRLVRTADDAVLFTRTLTHRSVGRLFLDWTADGAAPFREERDRALRALGAEIAAAVFGSPSPAEDLSPVSDAE